MKPNGNLVSAEWLLEHLNDPSLVILEASMKRPLPGKTNEVGEESIPHARHFDFETNICDLDSHLPCMMPTAAYFQEKVRALGVNQDSVVVVYDNMEVYSAPRAWWMLKSMGCESVYVLNGGLPAWKAIHGPVSRLSEETATLGNFASRPQANKMLGLAEIKANLDTQEALVLDARSAARFSGEEPDPRPNVKSGHIPKAKNLPFSVLQKDGHLLPAQDLKARFIKLGVASDDKLIFSCGSGVTACILALAASESGYNNIAVYDGSWSEWGTNEAHPVETGH
ncbi:sulfurtransferase [Alteromonas sp. a30]|uniref:sulfurtransferase n=1 Tax=Alteromonas sp. a30 TaxID=2730917 RepID=UPI002282CC16|nr:sulfurtransferase [Alteromonas sp. a30]MCY7295552.1 sulfurtransferase [Alteromonas sp. a30]